MELYNYQLKASYILEAVNEYVSSLPQNERERILELFEYDSYFELVSNFKMEPKMSNQGRSLIGLVAQNIVQRGFPTIAPRLIDDMRLLDGEELNVDDILNSLVIYDKEVETNTFMGYYGKTVDGRIDRIEPSGKEVDFIGRLDPFVFQHMEMQKPVEHLIRFPNTDASRYSYFTNYCLDMAMNDLVDHFKDQLIDFAISLPGGRCMNVEIDGSQHFDAVQAIKDRERDTLCRELEWKTLRIPTTELDEPRYMAQLDRLFSEYRSYVLPDSKPKDYVRIPLYAARYAVTFIHLVNCGVINFFEKGPIFLEIETMCRDAAVLGIRNAVDILYNLASMLENKSLAIPRIVLRVTALGGTRARNYTIRPMEEPKESVSVPAGFNRNCPVIRERMDSRLNLFGINYDLNELEYGRRKAICIFSALGQSHEYAVKHSSSRINYRLDEENDANLLYFLRNVFRKEEFRDKQVEIIRGLVEGHNVIGILPTGSGKSLTFQLPALLNPGTTIVVSPLISLMNDQVYNLKESGIGNVATINSTGTSAGKRLTLKRFEDYAYNFIYIAPERLQIAAFKSLLEYMDISLVVVDEAHCVSQWGHDFRTSYLRVGETVFNKVRGVNVAALTGTASCNVVADIKRELEITKNLKIVQADEFRRPELHFKVLHLDDSYSISEKLTQGKIPEIVTESVAMLRDGSDGLVDDFYEMDKGRYLHSGIVYSPYAVSEKASIDMIRSCLSKALPGVEFGAYHGKLTATVKNSQQGRFTLGESCLLIATKAFGMGIDKGNIRITIHLCVPESIEGFYQEAGRAGRDKQYALNVIAAPPSGTSYEACPDSDIHDFFMSNNYPPFEELIRQSKLYMDKKYITQHNFRELLSRSDDEDCLDGFQVVAKNNHIYIEFAASRSGIMLGTHQIGITDDNILEFGNVQKGSNIDDNVPARVYVGKVYDSVSKKFSSDENSAGISTPDQLFSEFNMYRISQGLSISGALRKAYESGNPVTCYVGLNANALSNPVSLVLHDLVSEVRMKHGRPMVINAGEKANLDGIRNAVKKHNRKTLFEFYSCLHSYAEAKDLLGIMDDRFIEIVRELNNSCLQNPSLNPELYEVFITCRDKDSVNVNTLAQFYRLVNGIRRNNGLDGLTLGGFCAEIESVNAVVSNSIEMVEEKIIYYLGLLGVYDSFERSYSPEYMKISVLKVTRDSLMDHIKAYIRRFETADYVKRRIKEDIFEGINDGDVVALVNAAFAFIIRYSYDKIKAYRCQQSKNMYACILEDDKENPKAFESAVYRYFDAKYESELIAFVKSETPKGAVDWLRRFKYDIDDNENEFAMINLSHLRTSAKKVLVDYDESYSLRLFEAYGILQDKDLLVEDGLEMYIEAIKKLKAMKRVRYTGQLNEFCEMCLDISDKEQLDNIQKSIDMNERYQKCPELKEFRTVLAGRLMTAEVSQ